MIIIFFESLDKEIMLNRHSLVSKMQRQNPSDHHSTHLNHLINHINPVHSGQTINHMDLTQVTRDQLFTPAKGVIQDQLLIPYRLNTSMIPTKDHLVSNHSQDLLSNHSIHSSLDRQKNSIKIYQDLPKSIFRANTSKNTNSVHTTDPNFPQPSCQLNITLNSQNLKIHYYQESQPYQLYRNSVSQNKMSLDLLLLRHHLDTHYRVSRQIR